MLGTAGHNTALQHQKCPLHLFGVDEEGHWKVGKFFGKFFGQIYPKQLRLVENSFDVGAKKDVADIVNVSKLHSGVLCFCAGNCDTK